MKEVSDYCKRIRIKPMKQSAANLKSFRRRLNSILGTRQTFVVGEKFGRERISGGTVSGHKMVSETEYNNRIAAILYHGQRTLPAGTIPPLFWKPHPQVTNYPCFSRCPHESPVSPPRGVEMMVRGRIFTLMSLQLSEWSYLHDTSRMCRIKQRQPLILALPKENAQT